MAIKTRRGSAGEDVTSTEQFVEDVVATDEDQSYEVEGTDSPEETVQEATVITDDHEVVNPIKDGEIVDEEIEETREGRRGRRTRRGSRKGATMVDGKSPMEYLKMLEELQGFPEEREIISSGDEDSAEEYLKKDAQLNNQTYEEAVRSIAEEYGDDSYLGGRNGSRKGDKEEDVEEVIMNEDGDTQEVELPEPNEEREGRRGKRTRRGVRRGSRKGRASDDTIDVIIDTAEREYGDLEELTGAQADDVCRKVAEQTGESYEEVRDLLKEMDELNGVERQGRRGSRKGNGYGGKSEVHQESIKTAVAVAMRDRRL